MSNVTPVAVAPTAQRTAEPSRFDLALQGAAQGAASGLAATVTLAAPYLPGGPILAGAVRGAVVGAAAPAPGTPGGSDIVDATRRLQQEAQSFNLQYLQLQESLQRESREFTALSNIMKVRHDSAKAAIGNIH
jgi:pyridoxal biosynthesis lyase PdxS